MTYLTNETGAVTVDWVVLTAALVGLGLATMGVVSSGVEDVSGDVEGQLSSTVIATTFEGLTGNAYGLAGYTIISQASYDTWAANYDAASVETLHADYLAVQTILQTRIDNGTDGWGPILGNAYHKMGAIAAELKTQGEALPEGAVLASEITAQMAASNATFAGYL